ncbi:MAG TPA: hypothetical protein VGE01_09190 [Fimbriimonas sp.]
MALSALLLSVLAQGPGVAPAQATDLGAQLVVVEPIRLAVSPVLDGTLGEEEWDPFADGEQSKSFLQWEPGKIHVAGILPPLHDLVVSIDVKNDGWLKGKDNIEVRIRQEGDRAVLSSRLLDATGKEGPVWTELPSVVQASEAVAREGQGGVFYEASIADAGLGLFSPERGQRFGVRYDAFPSDASDVAAFLPRAMSVITLATQRSAGMPNGLTPAVQDDFQTVVPGENMRMRVTFRGSNTLQIRRLSLRSEGDVRDRTLSLSTPFMVFDNKGRAFFDYDTRVSVESPFGYRLMRASVLAGDGLEGLIQASYRIAPLVDFTLRTKSIKANEANQVARVTYRIRSNSVSRVVGGVAVDLPEGWRNLSGQDKGYLLYQKGQPIDRSIDVEIPGGTQGVFPIKLKSVLGDQVTDQTLWITVQ